MGGRRWQIRMIGCPGESLGVRNDQPPKGKGSPFDQFDYLLRRKVGLPHLPFRADGVVHMLVAPDKPDRDAKAIKPRKDAKPSCHVWVEKGTWAHSVRD